MQGEGEGPVWGGLYVDFWEQPHHTSTYILCHWLELLEEYILLQRRLENLDWFWKIPRGKKASYIRIALLYLILIHYNIWIWKLSLPFFYWLKFAIGVQWDH